jgi:hypothetical protein
MPAESMPVDVVPVDVVPVDVAPAEVAPADVVPDGGAVRPATEQPATWAPDACTLPTADRPVRSAEFDTVFGAGLRRVSRLSPRHGQWEFAAGPDQVARIADLLRREAGCCSFFTFTLASGAPGTAVVDVTVPAAYADVLDALNQRAARRAGLTITGGQTAAGG